MICPKCGSENVRIDIINEVKTTHGGCLSWFFIILLSFLTFGIFLIIALILNWKVYSKKSKIGICQNCGFVIKFKNESENLINKWWVWLIAIIIFFSIIGGLSNTNQNTQKKDTKQSITETKPKEKNIKESEGKNIKGNFQELKEKGIQAVKEDRLSEGINIIQKALKQQADAELLKILDEAFYERAEYFYSEKKYQLAIDDIKEIKNNNQKVKQLHQKALANSTKIDLTDPLNGKKITTKNYNLQWISCSEADYYQIQVEDKNWNTVIYTTTKTNSFPLTQYFNDLSIYYWHVRAHYPEYGYGNWSDKNWFAIETPEGKIKKDNERIKGLIRVKNVYTSDPNSAGGVDLHVIWQNRSPKVIKYVTFSVVPYNAVNDIVRCDIKNESIFRGKVTGPVNYGEWEGESTYWECSWYNYSITRAELVEVDIIFMDGTTENIKKENIGIIRY